MRIKLPIISVDELVVECLVAEEMCDLQLPIMLKACYIRTNMNLTQSTFAMSLSDAATHLCRNKRHHAPTCYKQSFTLVRFCQVKRAETKDDIILHSRSIPVQKFR